MTEILQLCRRFRAKVVRLWKTHYSLRRLNSKSSLRALMASCAKVPCVLRAHQGQFAHGSRNHDAPDVSADLAFFTVELQCIDDPFVRS